MGCALKGGIHCISIYLRDSVGIAANLDVLLEVAALVKTIDGPWIIGGDFNDVPQAVADANWPQVLGGTIAAPSAPTCNGKTYDFFIICDKLAPLVSAVQVIDDAGLSPHSPCRLLLRADGGRKKGRRLRKPLAIPGTLPHGPPSRPPSYSSVHQLCDNQQLSEAMDNWYGMARTEWESLTGVTDQLRTPKFAWEPMFGAAKGARSDGTTPAVFWRVFARSLERG